MLMMMNHDLVHTPRTYASKRYLVHSTSFYFHIYIVSEAFMWIYGCIKLDHKHHSARYRWWTRFAFIWFL